MQFQILRWNLHAPLALADKVTAVNRRISYEKVQLA